jgi:hypothetical protein
MVSPDRWFSGINAKLYTKPFCPLASSILADTYMEHYLTEECYLRHSVLKQAEILVRGEPERFDCWAVTTRVDGVPIGQHVYDGADGLRLALSALEELWNQTRLESGGSPGQAAADKP